MGFLFDGIKKNGENNTIIFFVSCYYLFFVKTKNSKNSNQSWQNVYVKGVTINEKKLNANLLSHGTIINGGETVFEMSSEKD